MKYNYGLEKARFDKEWKTLEEEYISAGMTPQQILSLKAFDKSVFNSNRAYYRRNIRLESINEPSVEEDYLLSPLDDWTEEIDNDSLYQKLRLLPDEWKKAYILNTYYGYTQTEIAAFFGISQQKVSYWIGKIAEMI